jgi:outer membrane protein assembly factor BamA
VKLIPLILALILIPAPAKAQISLGIVDDRLAGPMPVNMESGFGDSLSVERFLRGLIASLHEQSYLEASVDSIVYDSSNATAYLHKGAKYNHVRITLDQVDEQVLRSLNIRTSRYEGRTIDISDFRLLQHRLLEHYENSGYPFAAAIIAPLELWGDTIAGRLTIKKNRYYIIDSIFIYGDPPVKREYLYRHIGISPGDPYSESRFMKTKDRLRETPFLKESREAEMEFMQKSADLHLYIERQQASRFSGILGILPGDAFSRTRLAGEINLDLVNSFRRMETLSLQWQSPGNQVQQADLRLQQPWLFGLPFGADIHMHMYRQDTSWLTVQAEAGILFNLPGSRIIRIFGKTYGTSLIGDKTAPGATGYQAADITGSVFGVSYRHSRINNRLNPYRGWEFNTSAGAGHKRVHPPPGFPGAGKERKSAFGEGLVNFGLFMPVTPATTLMMANLSGIRMNVGADTGDNYFFANELFLLGGLHSVRGFEERSLAATAYSILRVEYRYLFDESGNIFLFYDGMAYRQNLHNTFTSDMPYGFGAGMSFDTRAGRFSISYALGRQQGNPVSLRTAIIHIGLISGF